MFFHLSDALHQFETFLRRHLKSRAVREAEQRRQQRRNRELGRRTARAGVLAGLSGAAVLAADAAIVSLGGASLAVAGAAAATAAALSLSLRSRRAADRGVSRSELAELPGRAEDWLLDRRLELPAGAGPVLDLILDRIADLQPRLAELEPNSTLAWEVRRLLGGHLPALVNDYCELTRTARNADPALGRRLTESLTSIAEELARLCHEVSRERLLAFEARGRFLETRYRDSFDRP